MLMLLGANGFSLLIIIRMVLLIGPKQNLLSRDTQTYDINLFEIFFLIGYCLIDYICDSSLWMEAI